MENDQYPKTVTAATDILANHRHDNTKTRHDRQSHQRSQEEHPDDRSVTSETSFAQTGNIRCYCCGKSGHKSPDCPEKNTKPKNEWAI